MEEKKDFKIPEHIIEHYKKLYDSYPSIIQTRNVIGDCVEQLKSKNKTLWSSSYFDGNMTHIKEGILKYGSDNIILFFSKNDNEKVYKFFILHDADNNGNIFLLLKGLNKYFTID
jgi:hypothetical protein